LNVIHKWHTLVTCRSF